MNRTIAIFTLFLNILTLIGCSSKKTNDETSSPTDSTAVVSDSADTLTVLPADDSLPYVDLTKNYPLKKIDLREVADIKYVHLETTDKSLVSYPSDIYFRDGKILFEEFKTQEVLVFNEDGTFFTKISRQGGGPQEYRYILNYCVDFDNEFVYIWDLTFPPKIKVYDYDGYMQREFTVSDIPTPDAMYLFDENRLIVHCDPDPTSDEAQIVGSYPYRFIDIHTGKTTPIDIEMHDAVSKKISKRSGEHVSVSSIAIHPMLRRNNEVVISDYTYPIVYLQQGSKLKPLIRKSECSRSDTQETMSVIKAITERYILFYVATKSIDRDKCTVSIEKETELLYDRKTKEVCEVEFINPDTRKSVLLSWKGDMPLNTVIKTYDTEVLDLYNKKGYLSGELKDIAERMDPEDNPVLAIITFK